MVLLGGHCQGNMKPSACSEYSSDHPGCNFFFFDISLTKADQLLKMVVAGLSEVVVRPEQVCFFGCNLVQPIQMKVGLPTHS